MELVSYFLVYTKYIVVKLEAILPLQDLIQMEQLLLIQLLVSYLQ